MRFCRSLIRIRCRAQCLGWSTWPYMIVAVVRNPTRCAVSMTSSHWAVLILSGQITARTSSSRISAAVPGNVLRPASFRRTRYSSSGRFEVAAPCHTSNGEKAWMCISGTASLTAFKISMYVAPVYSGWIPPCIHTSVPPRSHASSVRRWISSWLRS